jgi:arylsulfatase A-like enzyme/Tfp pilus assembly protein PilF
MKRTLQPSKIVNLITICLLAIGLGLILLFQKLASVPKNNRLNVLLITIDTLRADYLSCYGSRKIETPNIDYLAKKGILFKFAVAHNVVTLPSHINILTGTYPIYHGVRDNSGFRLDKKNVMLSEVLKEKGYKTAAFIGAFPLDNRFGLDQGFDLYDDFYGDKNALNDLFFVERQAEKVIESAKKWLQKNGEDLWFCWIHLFDPHAPYNPPELFKDKYPDNFYAGEVAYTDFAIGELLQFLRKFQKEKNTLVILTADHGESLGEHGERTHGVFAYNSTLHIPLIFYQPIIFGESKSINQLVRHIDIMPTVLDILEIKIPKQVQGHSLLPLIKNPKKWKPKDSYFESLSPWLNRNWAPLQGIISENYKYIDLPIKELYDLKRDFREERNLAEENKLIIKKLDKRLKNIINNFSTEQSRKIQIIEEDAETLKKLHSLGYLGGTSPKSMTKPYTIEDDPKRLIELDHMMHEGIINYIKGDPWKAIEIFNEIIKRRPTFSLVYSNLSFVYHETGQLDKAIETLEKAISLGLKDQSLLSKLGIYLQEAGKFNRSVNILEALIKKYPLDVEILNYLGINYWHLGQYEKAIKTFNKLLSLDKSYASAYNNLGSVYLSMKQYDLAIKQFKKAIKYDSKLAAPYNGLGVIYASKRKYDLAIENWKKAVELDSKQYDALYNLGILLTKMNRFDEAIFYLEQFIATAPEYRYKTDIEKMEKLLTRLKSIK